MLCNLRHNNLVNNLLFLFNDLVFFIKKQDITCQEYLKKIKDRY